MVVIILTKQHGVYITYRDLVKIFTMAKNGKDSRGRMLFPKKDCILIFRASSSVKLWKDQYIFAQGFI